LTRAGTCCQNFRLFYETQPVPTGANNMVSGPETPNTRQDEIRRVIHKTLVFGELSAKQAGGETFEDPVIQTYFLHYLFGAVMALGEHGSLSSALSEEERVNAMGSALMTFEDATREDVMATLKMIYRAQDKAALDVQAEGRKAATAWDFGAVEEPTGRFAELLAEPGRLPREVDPSPPLGPATPPAGAG
jgi:hypothetical protein